MPPKSKTVTTLEITPDTETTVATPDVSEAISATEPMEAVETPTPGVRSYVRDYSSKAITTGTIQAKTDADLWAMAAAATNPNTPAFHNRTEVLKELVRRNKLNSGKPNAPKRSV
jgi:hypothetical protein